MTENETYPPGGPVVIGIDAGGSKTVAMVAGPDGTVLGCSRSGPANYHTVGAELAFTSMTAAVSAALRDAKRDRGDVRVLCLGAAGVDNPEDRELWEAWAMDVFPGVTLRINNDALLVLAAGTPAGWGIGVIAGSGSVVYGRDQHGILARAGGWGYLVGDEGSNYAIGMAALHAVTRAADGRGPQTALLKKILAHWDLPEPSCLISKIYGDVTHHDITRLGRIVEAAADEGDKTASDILERAGFELALAVRAVIVKLGFHGPTPCALAGAVLVRGKTVLGAFTRAAAEMGLELAPLSLVVDPAQGAVKMALEELR